jgi:hypothetical protein
VPAQVGERPRVQRDRCGIRPYAGSVFQGAGDPPKAPGAGPRGVSTRGAGDERRGLRDGARPPGVLPREPAGGEALAKDRPDHALMRRRLAWPGAAAPEHQEQRHDAHAAAEHTGQAQRCRNRPERRIPRGTHRIRRGGGRARVLGSRRSGDGAKQRPTGRLAARARSESLHQEMNPYQNGSTGRGEPEAPASRVGSGARFPHEASGLYRHLRYEDAASSTSTALS